MKVSLLIAASVATLLISCSKKTDDNTGGNIVQTLKIKTRATAAETTTYTYDTNGRIVTEISTDGRKTEYIYTPGEVRKIFTNNGLPNSSYLFYLNTEGFAIKTVPANNVNNTLEEYTYNSDKTISSQTNFNSTDTVKANYFYKNDNLDSMRYTKLNGDWFATRSFIYYLDRPAYFSYNNFGQLFFGKETKNIMKSMHEKYAGTLVYHFDFDYTYDSDGRAITLKTTDINGNVSLKTYTYY